MSHRLMEQSERKSDERITPRNPEDFRELVLYYLFPNGDPGEYEGNYQKEFPHGLRVGIHSNPYLMKKLYCI